MNDTVTKLMELADDYALWSSESQAEEARKRLQDELVRLFTPLTDERMQTIYDSSKEMVCMSVFGRAVEAAHGITGESK